MGLAVNKQANDNHLAVVERWLQTGRYPTSTECSECFQPPLYYGLNYAVAKALGVDDRDELLSVAHLWNFVFSTLILVLLAQLIDAHELSAAWKILLFLFISLNPKLIAINIQATNDTLIILLATVVLYLLTRLTNSFSLPGASLLWVFTLLASITKGNGLVLLVIVMLVTAFLIIRTCSLAKAEKGILLAVFLISLPLLTTQLGGYWDRYEAHGDPFVINQPKAPPPPLVRYDGYQGKRMGVRSIVDCFLTFRFVDLVRHPYIESGWKTSSEHRTSFWTQLYGQAFHAQFERHPPSWRTTRNDLNWLVRFLYVLGLIPLGLLLWGICLQVAACLREFRSNGADACVRSSLYLVFFTCFILFLIKYSIDYRDFANIKLIFIFPVLSALVSFLASAIDRLRNTRMEKAVFSILTLLCLGFVNNIGILLDTLIHHAQ